MPVVHIEYDDKQINDDDVLKLSNAVQRIVSEVTNIEDVFVYANTARIKVQVAAIEIFVYMSAHLAADPDALIKKIRTQIAEWKDQSSFPYKINLTLAPMQWKIEIGI